MNRLQTPDNNSFNGDSTPDRSIPDNSERGIKDKISCDENFALNSIKVDVEITHTYIGDLQVSLISPSGTSIILHNRSGASQNDLIATFDADSTPNLHAFTGEAVNGDWTLQVKDLASIDRGRLKSWSLELAGSDQPTIWLEESPGVTIPDNTQGGIERTLSVPDSGPLDTISIELDITHSYIGDLIVELVSPGGSSLLLHNRSGGSADNLIKTYGMSNTSVLHSLRGEDINGNWILKASDHANVDQGKLNRWAIKLGLM